MSSSGSVYIDTSVTSLTNGILTKMESFPKINKTYCFRDCSYLPEWHFSSFRHRNCFTEEKETFFTGTCTTRLLRLGKVHNPSPDILFGFDMMSNKESV